MRTSHSRLWRQALLMARKDMRLFFADRAALGFALVFPLLFVAIFSSFMGGFTGGGDSRMEVHLATHEGPGSFSQMIIDSLATAETGLKVTQVAPTEAAAALASGEFNGYLEFPADFSTRLMEGKSTQLTVHGDRDNPLAGGALDSLAQGIAAEITDRWVVSAATSRLAAQLGGPEALARLGEVLGTTPRGGEQQSVIVNYQRVGPAVGKSAANWVLPQYVTMFVFFTLAMTAEGLLMERENYTLDRLVANGARSGSILLGKYLGNVARGAIQAAVLWGAGILIFKVDAGYTPWMTFAVTTAIVLCASAFGLLIAAVARSRAAAGGMAVFGSLTMAPLGGCWWPLFMMPAWMQALARITPHAWANAAFGKLLLFAAEPASALGDILALLAFGALFGAVARWRFRVET